MALNYVQNTYHANGANGGYRVYTVNNTGLNNDVNISGTALKNLYPELPSADIGHVFKIMHRDEKLNYSCPSSTVLTCVAANNKFFSKKPYAYFVAHKPNEHVKVVMTDNMGTLDFSGEKIITFNGLVHMKRIGVVALGDVATNESFVLKDGSATTAINFVDVSGAGQLALAQNNPAGTVNEVYCDYISHKLHVKAFADVENPIKAAIYIVYDNDTDVPFKWEYVSSNDAATWQCATQVHAKYIGERKTIVLSGALGTTEKVTVKNGANAASNEVMITAAWAPVTGGNEVFKGAVPLFTYAGGEASKYISMTGSLTFIPAP